MSEEVEEVHAHLEGALEGVQKLVPGANVVIIASSIDMFEFVANCGPTDMRVLMSLASRALEKV